MGAGAPGKHGVGIWQQEVRPLTDWKRGALGGGRACCIRYVIEQGSLCCLVDDGVHVLLREHCLQHLQDVCCRFQA